MTYFFEGLDEKPSQSENDFSLEMITEALATKEGMRIALALSHIQNTGLRRRIADLLEAMITEEIEESLSNV